GGRRQHLRRGESSDVDFLKAGDPSGAGGIELMSRRYDVLKTPVVTEKSTFVKDKLHTVTFKVARGATKQEIKEAVEKIFKVKVASVRTDNFHGTMRGQGRYSGQRPD